jgi:hypothetical protein
LQLAVFPGFPVPFPKWAPFAVLEFATALTKANKESRQGTVILL